MGELIGVGTSVQYGFGLTGIVVSVLALGMFALATTERKNDDDDSSPGGGLMQPVA